MEKLNGLDIYTTDTQKFPEKHEYKCCVLVFCFVFVNVSVKQQT